MKTLEGKYRAVTTKNGFSSEDVIVKRSLRQTKVFIGGLVFDEDRKYFVVEKGEVKLYKL